MLSVLFFDTLCPYFEIKQIKSISLDSIMESIAWEDIVPKPQISELF